MISANSTDLRAAYDVVVVGGGPAGLTAARAAQLAGAQHVLIVDREQEAGGILLQCIHTGFGLHYFGAELTGPEYAQRLLEQVLEHEIDVLTEAYVLDIDRERRVKLMSGSHGVRVIAAQAIVLATGARERTRGAIQIPGTRPAGVFTAGLAQRFVNLMGVLPGRRAVILGSGDIGLIMARRLTLEGVEVAGVFEIMPHANGLNRNLVQCLQDFAIPLHLSTTVVEIHGQERVTSVTAAPVDEQRRPLLGQAWNIPCDTLLLSIGLIPDNELAHRLRLRLDPLTQGPMVSSALETSLNGVFACGNAVHIHDLVDFVSQEAALAGRSAGEFVCGRLPPADNVRLLPGENVAYCVPHTLATEREQVVFLRVRQPLDKAIIRLSGGGGAPLLEKKVRYVCPAETLNLTLRTQLLAQFHGDALRIDVTARAA